MPQSQLINRSFKFWAAFSVNVVIIMERGLTPSTNNSLRHLKTKLSVLPDPGPAIIHRGPVPNSIICFWFGINFIVLPGIPLNSSYNW